jgi:hypothetical protein
VTEPFAIVVQAGINSVENREPVSSVVGELGMIMTELVSLERGGYRFLKSVFQYSAGVVASPGFEIVRVRFFRPVLIGDAFSRIERMIASEKRPISAFCACELRSPHPVSDNGFYDFNKRYVERLGRWGIFDGTQNPVARSNVCPAIDPPKEPSVYAFSYTREAKNAEPSFVVSGGAEAPEGRANYRDHIVRLGDLSKDEMSHRLSALGFSWADTTGAHVYTIRSLDQGVGEEMSKRGGVYTGLNWQYCRPPVADLEFEMDCRRIFVERIEK